MLLIILALTLLFFRNKPEEKPVIKKAERTLEQIGLEKEDLEENQRHKVLLTLMKHPQEARQLEQIVRETVLDEMLSGVA